MRFLFIVSGRSVPSTRFRILPYLPMLRDAGHRCDVAYSFPEKYEYFRAIGWRASQFLKRSTRQWHAWLASVRHYDAIIIEREVFDDDTSDIEAKLRKRTGRLILDVDDGVHLKHPEKFETVARMCDVAVAGNRELENVLNPFCPRTVRIPTCVRMSEYPLRGFPSKRTAAGDRSLTSDGIKIPTVGWIGTTHNVAFLEVCAEALRETAKTIDFRLLVVAPSDQFLKPMDLRGVDVQFRKWNPDTEVDELTEMDIGLMPLPPGEDWMKFKCGLKLIQYLAVGSPGIASPIGVNGEILEGEHVGIAAETTAQWADALTRLLRDAALRERMGRAGRKLVQDQYSIEANWMKWESVLTGRS
jgi:glycosyltransferase involved in cell wall biosynthesis